MSLATIIALGALLGASPQVHATGINPVVMQLSASAEMPHQDANQSQPADSSSSAVSTEPTAPQPADQAGKPEEGSASGTQAQPDSGSASQQSQPAAPEAPPKPAAQPVHKKKVSKQGAATAKKKSAVSKKPGAKPASTDSTPKVVIHNGGATDPAIELTPSLTKQQTDAKVQDTNKLLDATEANLKKISSRPLNPSQEDMVKQIKTYMQQAKSAAADGDLQQASNLATKAHMLSDELAK